MVRQGGVLGRFAYQSHGHPSSRVPKQSSVNLNQFVKATPVTLSGLLLLRSLQCTRLNSALTDPVNADSWVWAAIWLTESVSE